MSTPQYGDYQFDIYFDGLEGQLPNYGFPTLADLRAAGAQRIEP